MNQDQLGPAVENFRQFLIAGYPHWRAVHDLACKVEEMDIEQDFADMFDDWAQANWELLVERPIGGLGEFLLEYGSGSDWEGGLDSRVFFSSVEATHEVVCIAKGSAIDILECEPVDLSEFSFERFVSLKGTWYEISEPFDHVLLHERGVYGGNYREIVVPLEQIEFSVRERPENN